MSKPMTRSLLLVIAALLLVFVAVACGGGPSTATAPSAPAQAPTAAAQAPAQKPAETKPTEAKAAAPAAPSGPILFHSSQFTPVAEREKMQNIILKDFPAKVDYAPQDPGPFVDIVTAQAKAGKMEVGVIGGLHGDFPTFIKDGILDDLTPLLTKLQDRKFPATFVELGKMGTKDKQYYIPWAQATYIMVANKKALQYLPQGANVDSLTYDQLKQWSANVQKGTGERKLGFPAGPKGLMHRFTQGFLYPSYTGQPVTNFKSPEAVKMWTDFKDMWQYVNPASTNYDFMQEPLKSGEVWIAFDHVARLIDALKEKPDDYVTFPAPSGPKGLGHMPVVLGLALPKNGPNRATAEQLIDYMTQPKTQIAVARELGFYPVVDAPLPADLPAGVKLEAEAIAKQSNAKNAIQSLLPVGLGAKGGEWNKVYQDTLTRIVLKGEDPAKVLDEQAKIAQSILDETKAPCWAPDPVGEGTCKIK